MLLFVHVTLFFPLPFCILTPDLDGDITALERSDAEMLISQELAAQPSPKPNELPPSPSFQLLLMQDIKQHEDACARGAEEPSSIVGLVIDILRYNEALLEPADLNAVYTSLSYAILRDRSSKLQLQNVGGLAAVGSLLNASMARVVEIQKAEISRKQAALEQVQSLRALKQLRYAPVESHLSERWKNGVRFLVDASLQE